MLAADGHEAQLAHELEQLIELGQLPDLNALTALLAPPRRELPDVAVQLPLLAGYDELIESASGELRDLGIGRSEIPHVLDEDPRR